MRAVLRSLLVVVAAWSTLAHAQPVQQASNTRRPITPADIKAWNALRGATLSNDGKWFAYVVGPSEADATLIVKSTTDAAKEMKFSVGGTGGGTFTISGDSKWIGFTIAPPTPPANAASGRGGRGAAPAGAANNTARNKFALVNLATGEKKEFERIRSFQFAGDTPAWIALQGYGAGAPAAAADPNAAGGRGGFPGGGAAPAVQPGDLNLYRIATGEVVNIGNVGEFGFDNDGVFLAYTTETPDMIGNGVQIRNLRTDVSKSFDSDRALYRRLVWNDTIDALAVLRGVIDTVRRDTLFSIVTLTAFDASGPTKKMVFNPSEHADFPKDMKIAVARAPRFSSDLQTLFFGVRAANKPPVGGRGMVASNTASVIQAGAPGAGGNVDPTPGAGRGNAAPNADNPSLVLWHSKDSRLQWQQIVQEQNDRNFNYLAQYRIPENKVIQLVTDDLRTVNLATGDRNAYGLDTREYETGAVTTGRNFADVYQVDLRTGERKVVFRKQPSTNTFLRSSPNGLRALYWGTDGHWWVHDFATGAQKNITKGVTATSFVNVEDDHNNIYPPSYQAHGWSKDNASVLLSDGWDIWKVPVDGGTAVNLTGNGKKDQIRYRTINTTWTLPAGRRSPAAFTAGIDLSKPLYVNMYGEWTKKEGVARVEAGKAGATTIFFEPASFAVQKARDADTYVMTRQTFTEYPNYWLASADLKPVRQLTDVNPQMKDIAWSSGTKLIDYVSDKGDKLQAAMYLPANYDPSKKYPMLVTIYEKRSQGLNRFTSPSETRAPDPAQYTSNGYIVLDPDIVYKINDPGMSAVWCVIPAVKAAIATGSVDEKKIGLWGHSWGGYQTAFLVTQTDMFSAAIAGAPLTNMVSMYGSVYWNSGSTDAAIFESSQGRFKGSFIENHEAYIRNSPVFFADKVKTPLVILHNDKDGAVDFNQGVTYFTTLVNQKKDVIMLEYVGENHGLARPANQKDYAGRMREFFDHHLTGKPAEEWIRSGVPRLKMDEHLLQRKAAADSAAKKPIVP
ncbi:MAG TPA: prolyl oligopeptidase family serine peptidase [Gemmatimonadaceae bacterium]|nr:prolyl oligopeptidase family serine peptidase [Gemmatimonadaceae bacterium]